MLKAFRWTALAMTVFFSGAYSQKANIDSLKQVLNSNVRDTLKLDAAGILMVNVPSDSKEYSYYNEKAKKIAERMLTDESLDKASVARARVAVGVYNVNKAFQYMQSDYLTSIKYLEKSLEYFDGPSKKTKITKANLLVNTGIMYSKIGNTKIAVNYFFEALRYFESIKDAGGAAFATQNIANLYKRQKKYKDALAYYLKTDLLFLKLKQVDFQDATQKVFLYVNIANCYQQLGNCALAKTYLDKSLTLAQDLENPETLSEVYFELGTNEEKCNASAPGALKQFQKAYDGSKQPEIHSKASIAIGKILLMQKDYATAESMLLDGLAIAKQISNLEYQQEATDNLVKLYKTKHQFRDALTMKDLNSAIKDSIKSEQNNTTLLRKQLEYDYASKEKIAKLTQQQKLKTIKLEAQKEKAAKNYWRIALSGLLLLLLLGVYFYYRNNKQKQAISVLEKNQIKQKLLVSQMNPHFIFNSIENIQELIFDQKNVEAVNYLNKFSALTRQILEHSNETYISLSEEVEMISNYMAIQQLLYSGKFEFTIAIDETIDAEAIFLPPMLTQPFIENAIKHGLSGKQKNGSVAIRFYLEREKLLFEVADNGNGFDASKKAHNHKSLAMAITKERLINYTKNNAFEVRVSNLTDASQTTVGAKVVFEIPYIYEK